MAGVAGAGFLHGLELATRAREANPLLILGLPLAAGATVWAYARIGEVGGTADLRAAMRGEGSGLPPRAAPRVLVATWIAHLFGASIGREGTGVQMGGALANLLPARDDQRAVLTAAGVAGGFGAVFGTPIAGVVFAAELAGLRPTVGGIAGTAVAAFVADGVARLLRAPHAHYAPVPLAMDTRTLAALLLVAGAAALLARLFNASLAAAKDVRLPPIGKAAAAGAVVAGLTGLLGTTRYNGISTDLIPLALAGTAPLLAFAFKGLLTVVSVGGGIKGGEVTPLLVIGACLGSTLATTVGAPPALVAVAGFAALFGAAAGTPFACAVMAAEIFGQAVLLPLLPVCLLALAGAGPLRLYRPKRLAPTRMDVAGDAPEVGGGG